MTKIIYYFIIIVAGFVVSFINRECMFIKNNAYNDERMGSLVTESHEEYLDNSVDTLGTSDKSGQGILISSKEKFTHYTYMVKDYQGHVCVFNYQGSLLRITAEVTDGLEKEMKSNVKNGLYFATIEDVWGFLAGL
jgi:hypothetical protein